MIYLAHYRTHKSVEDLKRSEKAHIQKHKLTGNLRKVLELLVKHSLGNLGACKLKAQTIADEIGISRATVTRCIKKLRDLNIIESHADTKSNGIKGANIYNIIFLSHGEPSSEPSGMSHRAVHANTVISTVEHVKHESESFNSFNLSFNPFVINNVNTYSPCDTAQDLKSQLRNIYNPQSVEGNVAFEELCKIAFGRIKQYMKSHNMPYLQMEQMVLNCMRALVNKQGVRNQFALYSAMIKRQVEQLFESFKQPQTRLNNGRNEKIPDWFDKRNEPSTVVDNGVDFEAERQKVLAKLGACQQ